MAQRQSAGVRALRHTRRRASRISFNSMAPLKRVIPTTSWGHVQIPLVHSCVLESAAAVAPPLFSAFQNPPASSLLSNSCLPSILLRTPPTGYASRVGNTRLMPCAHGSTPHDSPSCTCSCIPAQQLVQYRCSIFCSPYFSALDVSLDKNLRMSLPNYLPADTTSIPLSLWDFPSLALLVYIWRRFLPEPLETKVQSPPSNDMYHIYPFVCIVSHV